MPSDDGTCPACRRSLRQQTATESESDARVDSDEVAPSESPYAGLVKKLRPVQSPAQQQFSAKEPVLVVTRSRESLSMRGAFLFLLNVYRMLVGSQTFRVEVDGDVVAELDEGQECRVPLPPGEHRLRVTTRMGASRTICFTIRNGQRLWYACSPKMFGVLLRRID